MKKTKEYYKNVLSPLKSKIKTHNYIGFDIETVEVDGEHIFYFGSIVSDYFYMIFFCKEEMINEVLKPKYANYIFVATNLTFDFLGVFSRDKEFNNFKLIFRGSDLLCCSYKCDGKKGTIKFLDTFNYIGFSVKKLGKIVGVDKLNSPEYIGKRKSKTREELEEFIIYNIYDSYISYSFMNFLQKGTNLLGGELKITIASSSLNIFRRNYLIHDLRKEKHILKDDSVEELIRSAYFGGRTEVFEKGLHNNLNYYDINSLYPSVMYKYEIPISNSVKKIDEPHISNIINYHGVSYCYVKTPDDIDKPVLPKRCSKTNKLEFPIGEWFGSYNNVELIKAIKKGYKIVPIQQIIYTKSKKMFCKYIKELYDLRLKYKKDKSSMELIVKLYMNSLYGKFGQYNTTESDIKSIDNLSQEDKKKILLKDTNYDIKNDIAIKNENSVYDGNHAFCIISSTITSLARLELYKYLEKYNVLYCDTDSIVTTDTIKTSDKLGDMKLEGVLEECEFFKPKMYYMKFLGEEEKIIKIKGVTRCNYEELQEIINNKSVNRIKFSKLKESIRRGIEPNSVIEVNKNVSLQDDKRLWFGNISVPKYINDGDVK